MESASTRLPEDSVHFDDLGPERIFHYYDPVSRLRAVVVIDTTRFGLTAGGVRMAADLTLTEIVRLARAMSYKFAMLDLPCGGAKAGIWLDPSAPARPQVMRAFLEAIRPLVESRAYMAGADMGTSAADFSPLHGGSQSFGERDYEGMPLEDQATGYGVVVAAGAACECLELPMQAAAVAIEGFGKVGAGAAKYFARAGARVVAVSTIQGGLFDPGGLDVPTLLGLRAAHGDALVHHYPRAQAIPRAALLSLSVDCLVPGARPDAINDTNVDAIAARIVVPAANIPYADGTVKRLHDRGIVALPDFVTNAGGVLLGLVELQGGSVEDVFTSVRQRIDPNVRRVIEAARRFDGAAYDAAVRLARQRLLGEA